MLKDILTSPALLPIINGQLRHLGTIAGTALATYGVIEAGDVPAFAGAALTIVSMLLSALAKRI